MTKVRVAVLGCCHGQLNAAYRTVARMNANKKIDLLIILGDFQSLRSPDDFDSLSVPPKYRRLGDFHKYYSGELEAPVPTVFIGGNHESMRHLMLLPHGGYVAKNIFYLGYSNVFWFKGVRIGSLSGIWKDWDFDKPRPSWSEMERQHWKRNVKSLYHVRQSDVIPLFMMDNAKKMDIMLSHDWPTDVVYYGDTEELLRTKPFFKKDIEQRDLGSPINSELLQKIQPSWWLSAHLHVKFRALISHKTDFNTPSEGFKNADEIELDLDLDSDNDEVMSKVTEEVKSIRETSFLALDKCMPKRQWLEVIEVEADTQHPSYTTGKAYWDSEFIKNLQFLEEHKELPFSKKIDKYNWAELVHQRDSEIKDDIDQEPGKYEIPEYENGIQSQEAAQTELFYEKYVCRQK